MNMKHEGITQMFAEKDPEWWDPENERVDLRTKVWTGASDWLLRSAEEMANGGTAIDLGCGRGRISKALADRGYRVTAVDVNPDMLKFVEGDSRIETMLADITDVPIQHQRFDIVSAVLVTEHVPSVDKLCEEMYRLLKEEGRGLLTITNSRSLYAWWTMNANAGRLRPMKFYLRRQIDPSQMAAILKEAGLEIVAVRGFGTVSPLSWEPGWKKVVVGMKFAALISKLLDPLLGRKYGHVVAYVVERKKENG